MRDVDKEYLDKVKEEHGEMGFKFIDDKFIKTTCIDCGVGPVISENKETARCYKCYCKWHRRKVADRLERKRKIRRMKP